MAWQEFCRRFHSRTPFRDTEPDVASGSKLFRRCLASRLGCVLVSTHGGKIDGTLVGVAEEWWWCRKRVASDLLFYADSAWASIALLRAFIAWGSAVPGVVDVICGQSSGIEVERMEILYKRVGLSRIGGLYHMRRAT